MPALHFAFAWSRRGQVAVLERRKNKKLSKELAEAQGVIELGRAFLLVQSEENAVAYGRALNAYTAAMGTEK